MTNKVKCERRMSEIRTRLRDLLESDSPTDGEKAETEALTKELREVEVRYQAALAVEPDDVDVSTPEGAELEGIKGRTNLGAFFDEVLTGKQVDGADHEYRQAILGDGAQASRVPLAMLDDGPPTVSPDGMEHRAVTPVAASAVTAGTQASIAARIFSRTVAGRLGIPMPTVPVGEAGYPYLSSGTTVSMQAKSGEQAAVAGTFAGSSLKPVRLTGAYEFRIEDTYELRGLDAALRADLRMALSDAMDDQILTGNGTSPNVTGIMSELTAPSDPGSVDTATTFREKFTSNVDGIYSYGLSDLRCVLGTHAYQFADKVYRTTNVADSAYWGIQREVAEIFVSSRMPAATSNISQILIHKTAYPGLTGVAPMWNSIELIVDPYTLATKGERRITAIMLWNFKLVREAAFEIEKVRSA